MKKIKGLDCILLVDDEEVSHFLNKILIKKANIDVHMQSAYDGMEALNYLVTHIDCFPKPGIIFLDINMPKMNGWEFVEKFKELQLGTKVILIVMLTSSINYNDKKKAMEISEIHDYITKPLTITKFNEIISRDFENLDY